jgi:universal bacterial protein yeaZ
MISLFIDTSLLNVSISVVKDGHTLSLISKSVPNMHSIYTTSFLKQALDDAKISPKEIDEIYVVDGPGSFTGLRIGVTIAKTYGYIIKKDITPVSTLKAYAISSKDNYPVMSIIPANKTHYYIGIYNENFDSIVPEQFASYDRVLELITKYNPILVGVDNYFLSDFKVNKVELDIPKIINYYKNKEKVNYYKLVPNYLKLPQALEDKKVKE